MYEILILIKGYSIDHVNKLYLTLNTFIGKGIKCNIEKSFFGKTKMQYLLFWVTYNGVKPKKKKIEFITNMAPPNSRKEVRKFIGVVNNY